MEPVLKGKKVAILVTDGFEHSELAEPMAALDRAGAEVHIVSPNRTSVMSWKDNNWGEAFKVHRTLDTAASADYDGLILPGGVINPDRLRANMDAVNLVKDFFLAGKTVAAICHGVWLLAEADVARGLKLTSYESIKTDLKNAGANWVDEEVVIDQGVVTSRKPQDLPAFIKETVKSLQATAEGRRRAS